MTTATVITVDEARVRCMRGQAIGFISLQEWGDLLPQDALANPFHYMEIVITCGSYPKSNARLFKRITERAFVFFSVEGEAAAP